MLTLRAPSPLDLPTLYALALDHKGKFLDDYTEFDLDYAQAILASPTTLVIDEYGFAVGAVWFDDTLEGIRTTVHGLIRPEKVRALIKDDIFGKAVDWAFEEMRVKKVIAECMSTMQMAQGLLRRYKFQEHRPFFKHTKQNGVLVDVIWFEAKRHYWSKMRGNRQEEKQLPSE